MQLKSLLYRLTLTKIGKQFYIQSMLSKNKQILSSSPYFSSILEIVPDDDNFCISTKDAEANTKSKTQRCKNRPSSSPKASPKNSTFILKQKNQAESTIFGQSDRQSLCFETPKKSIASTLNFTPSTTKSFIKLNLQTDRVAHSCYNMLSQRNHHDLDDKIGQIRRKFQLQRNKVYQKYTCIQKQRDNRKAQSQIRSINKAKMQIAQINKTNQLKGYKYQIIKEQQSLKKQQNAINALSLQSTFSSQPFQFTPSNTLPRFKSATSVIQPLKFSNFDRYETFSPRKYIRKEIPQVQRYKRRCE